MFGFYVVIFLALYLIYKLFDAKLIGSMYRIFIGIISDIELVSKNFPSFRSDTILFRISVQLNLSKTASLKRPKIGFQDQLSLNASQKYCRMLQWEYFRPSLSYHLSLRSLFCLFEKPF